MEVLLVLLSVLGMAFAQIPEVPPKISEPLVAQTVYARETRDLQLLCNASGKPEPVYKWLKDGKRVETTRDVSFDARSGILTIKNYKRDYDGDYQCVASIGETSSMSQIQSVRMRYLGPFLSDDDTIQHSVDEYAYFKIDCAKQGQIVNDRADFSYNWYFSRDSTQIDKQGGRLFVDQNGNLHFAFVKLTDATKAGRQYLCGYSSVTLKTILMGDFNSLVVNDKPGSASRKPILMYSNSNLKARIGTTARLECFFSGYDATTNDNLPTLKWFDNANNEILDNSHGGKYMLPSEDPEDPTLPRGKILQINSLKEEDERTYFCMATTSAGSTEKQPVRLNITSPPIWVLPPENMVKSVGNNAVFNCATRSLSNEEPPETPIWYINGKKTDNSLDFNHFRFSADKKRLTIDNVQKPDDILCVQCSVKNSEGSIFGDGCLNVLEPIVFLTRPPAKQQIKKGDNIMLNVDVTTDPFIRRDLGVQWIFKNNTYKPPNYPPYATIHPTTKALYINTSQLTQEEYETVAGTYACIASHLYDSVTITTEVELMDAVLPPVVPVTASAGFDMWIIGLIIGILFLLIVVAIIIFVICRKQQEGDYNVDKKETGAGLDPEKELRDKGFNDLSRPDYDDYDYPEKKPRGDLEYDDVPIGGDDESLGEYGDEEDTHFNEDGSFIGIYQKKENERQNMKTSESTI